jgi:hypothetical protein
MSFKKHTITKLVLFFLISFTFIYPTKIKGLTQSELIKEYEEAEEAKKPGNVNQENWIESSALTNAVIGNQSLGGVGIASASASTSHSPWIPGGFIGLTSNAIASLYNPPISGTQYIANSINSLLGKPTYAASTGGTFNHLTGILPIWKICRNTVYVLFSIIFVVIGLLIMLRIKISPQATITIQNSIPKIIITLILVTFSYAIVGLLIDLTYLVQALILSSLISGIESQSSISSTLLSNIPKLNDLIMGSNGTYWSLVWSNWWDLNLSTGGLITSGITGIIGAVMALLSGWGWATLFAFAIGVLIILIIVFIQLIKFFFGCAKAYLILLLKIISAPIEIALGAFPSSKIGFGSWFIQTLAYASVFPISLIFLVILNIFMNVIDANQIWVPGVLYGGVVSLFLKPIIGIAGLFILAKLPNLIPEAIFQIKPSPFGKALSEGITQNGLVRGVSGGLSFAASQRIANMKFSNVGKNRLERQEINETRQYLKSQKKHQGYRPTPIPPEASPLHDTTNKIEEE